MAQWIVLLLFLAYFFGMSAYWVHKATREHLQLRNAAHHLRQQNRLIALQWQVTQLERQQQESNNS